MSSAEAIEYLGISRARLSQLIKNGKLIPIKKLQRDSLFLKIDVEKKK
ncbi:MULTISPECIES: helix-turn-helix domain-containing protein [Aneurinibacillus]|nr:helix-turn-helix domain-containing protein [Aneurinibacillus thermoaerophilus]